MDISEIMRLPAVSVLHILRKYDEKVKAKEEKEISDKRTEIIERIISYINCPEYLRNEPAFYEFVEHTFNRVNDEDKTMIIVNDVVETGMKLRECLMKHHGDTVD